MCFPVSCPQPISNADFIVPVEIDGTVHQVQFKCVQMWPWVNVHTLSESGLYFGIQCHLTSTIGVMKFKKYSGFHTR